MPTPSGRTEGPPVSRVVSVNGEASDSRRSAADGRHRAAGLARSARRECGRPASAPLTGSARCARADALHRGRPGRAEPVALERAAAFRRAARRAAPALGARARAPTRPHRYARSGRSPHPCAASVDAAAARTPPRPPPAAGRAVRHPGRSLRRRGGRRRAPVGSQSGRSPPRLHRASPRDAPRLPAPAAVPRDRALGRVRRGRGGGARARRPRRRF